MIDWPISVNRRGHPLTDRFSAPLRVTFAVSLILFCLLASANLHGQERASSFVLTSRPHSVDLTTRAASAPAPDTIKSLETRVSAAPTVEIVPGADVPSPSTAAGATFGALERGKNYRVQLSKFDEATFVQQVAAQPSIRAEGVQLVTSSGALRQLASDGSALLLKPIIIAQPLTFNAALHMFVGSIKVGVSEIGEPGNAKALSAPVSFQVLEGDLANPEELEVKHSGLPMSKFEIQSPQAAGGLIVNVASTFDPAGVPVTLKLVPVFRVAAPKSMDGLGLETATIRVSASGLPNLDTQTVGITVDGPARADGDTVHLDKSGHGIMGIRSVGIGSAVVTAQLEGFPDASVGVKVAPPFLTLLASLVGGLTGGLIRLLPSLSGNTMRRFWLGLSVSVLVGLVVFGLYAIGVNVLPIQPKVQVGAVFVAVVSAMGALLGSKILGAPKAQSTS